jgi:glycosyltransferase involved in cell wall biosynthesis
VVEALAAGTPVIATSVGGVGEVVHDGVNGLLVPAGDARALADAVRRYFADDELRDRLHRAAAESVSAYDRDTVFGQIERALAAAVTG